MNKIHRSLWLPVCLALLALANHLYRVNFNDLSIWKGGGMGMFATQDGSVPGSGVNRNRW